MSKQRGKIKARAEPMSRSNQTKSVNSNTGLLVYDNLDAILSLGYTRLIDNPEVQAGVNKIANLISTITIHLMENSNNGDIRIKNQLSRIMDIYPNMYMTRSTFISSIVRFLLLEGDGNAFYYVNTKDGLIDGIYPIRPGLATCVQDGMFGYKIMLNGKLYDPTEIGHVVINPDIDCPWKGTGYRASLRNVVDTLSQAQSTKKEFMSSKWKPSIIVKADAMVDEFSTSEGREKLLDKYISTQKAGQPWIIPADGFEVTTVKPLSLTDLAISDSVKLDKASVASILDVPPFVLGIGTFNKEEWNNWINTRIKYICTCIEQSFTRLILINPNWYFKFNIRSLYSWDLQTLSTVGCDLMTRGILTRNEVRDSIGYSPMDGLDELVILENYIPVGMIGNQKKLIQGGDENG